MAELSGMLPPRGRVEPSSESSVHSLDFSEVWGKMGKFNGYFHRQERAL
jgi:hypothetical protein